MPIITESSQKKPDKVNTLEMSMLLRACHPQNFNQDVVENIKKEFL